MDDLVRWLTAQLDADAARAEEAAAVQGGHWSAQSLQSGRREPRHYVGASVEAGVARSDSEVLSGGVAPVRHAAAHDPARVLRDIDAKRGIVRAYEAAVAAFNDSGPAMANYERLTGSVSSLRGRVELLATAYSDRPGFREEWRP